MDIANLVIRVTNDGLTAAQRELRRLRDEADGTQSSTSKLGENLKSLAKYGAVSMGALAVAAIKVSGDFEESMNAVRAVSGATGKDFDDLRNLAKKMGAETAFSATEAANGMEYLAMAGMNTQQVLATIPNALSLAAAGSIDLAQSADILSNIMSGMGIAAEESARVADVLAQTAAGANTNISALGEAMKYVAPIAKTMGYSLEEASAAIGILGNAGIAGGQAGTSLRAILSRIAADKGAKETLADLGVTAVDSSGKMRSLTDILTDLQVKTKDLSSADQIEVFKDIAGAEAMGALAVLVDGVANDSLPQLTAKLMEAEGAAQKMAEIRMEGLNGAIKTAKSAAEGFLIAIGDAGLLDLAANGVKMLADGISQLSAWLPQAAEQVTAFFQSAEVATAVDMAIEGLTAAWENLVSVIQATADVIAPVIEFFREHDKLSEALAISIGLVGGAFVIYNAAVVIGTAVTGAFVGVLLLVTSPIFLIVAAMVALTAAGVYVYQNWDLIKQKATEIWGAITTYISNKINEIKNYFSTNFPAMTAIVSSSIEVIKTLFVGGFALIKNTVTTVLGVIKAVISGDFKAIPGIIGNGLKAAAGIVGSMMTNILNIIREAGKKLFNIGRDFIQGFINGIKSVGSGVVSAASSMVGNAIAAVKKRQDSASPSKVTTKLGGDFSQGMANGIKKGAKAVKTEAQKMAEGAVKAVQDGVASLKREIALFGNDSPLSALDYDIKVGKFGGANTGELRSLTEKLETTKRLADANKSVQDSIDGLIKQQALFGNSSSLAALMYDIEHTDKYKDATKELTDGLIEQTRAFEQLGMTAKATEAIKARFAKLRADQESSGDALMGVMGEIKEETPLGKLQADYEARLAKVEEYEKTHTDMLENAKIARLAIEQSYMDAKQQIMLGQSEAIFSGLAGITKGFLGEQSGVYRALYAMQKGYALSSALLSSKKAIMDAWSNTAGGYFAKAAAAGKVLLSTSAITGAIAGLSPQGFKSGGYTGNMGASQVAGVVHGQEYVFDAQSTKRIGVDNLNAMRSGKSVGGGDVNINVVVDAKGNAQVSGDNERMGRDMANGIKAVVMDTLRKEKRQGGMLYA